MIPRLNEITGYFYNPPVRHMLTICFVSGSIATLALPPIYVFPSIFFLSISIFYFFKTTKSIESFLIGFISGFGWFLFSFYWIVFSLFVAGSSFFWMIPFVLFGLPMFLSIFWGLAFLLSFLLSESKTGKLLLLIIFWNFFEWIRGNIMTGLPWNMPGSSISFSMETAQTVSFIGPYGQNLVMILLITSPILWVIKEKIITIVFLILTSILFLMGSYRFHSTEIIETQMVARLVQPSFSHKEKWNKNLFSENLNLLINLSTKNNKQKNLIIWPETAITVFPEYIAEEIPIIASQALGKFKSTLITGIPIKSIEDNNETKYFNSMLMFNSKGEVKGAYNKIRLVPFGEYIPLRKFLPFASSLASKSDFSPGSLKNTFSINGFGIIQPMICFEAIFPGFLNGFGKANLLVNITNDFWFGNTLGPEQHLALARQRSVESGIPLLRVSNSGISAGYDPLGQELGRIEFGETNYLDITIPEKLSSTFYNKWGDKIFFTMIFLLIIVFILKLLKSRVDNKVYFERDS